MPGSGLADNGIIDLEKTAPAAAPDAAIKARKAAHIARLEQISREREAAEQADAEEEGLRAQVAAAEQEAIAAAADRQAKKRAREQAVEAALGGQQQPFQHEVPYCHLPAGQRPVRQLPEQLHAPFGAYAGTSEPPIQNAAHPSSHPGHCGYPAPQQAQHSMSSHSHIPGVHLSQQYGVPFTSAPSTSRGAAFDPAAPCCYSLPP
eukprot:6188511-Pleurochrysis_carterae.AAC.1